MSNIIMRYEDYLIHTKHASDNTVASYMRDLRQYASYLGSEGIDVLDADQDVVSGYMNSMKANGKSAATISYGHVGADLITLCSMLRIPVCMHNVADKDVFRPAAWNAFGMDKEGQDYRACAAYGPMYKNIR